MKQTLSKGQLNSNQLKLIAIAAMTFDHLVWTFFPGCQYVWWVWSLHIVGRITAPIMWFFIAEGCFYTRNKGRYTARLFFFAVLSHFAFDFAFGIPFFDPAAGIFGRTSVLWSLAIASAVIFLTQSKKMPMIWKYVLLAAACIVSLPSDWSAIAVVCPFFLYQHRGDFKKQARDIGIWTFIYALFYFIFLDKPYAFLQLLTCLSIPLLSRYNGRRGNGKGMKWFFYIYYPAHLVVIGILRLLIHSNI